MQKNIVIKGIKTNNLKNIDVEIIKNGINVIIGPSGSGKSSLAYDTIAEIGVRELNSMYADSIEEPSYKVSFFKNMITTIPIKQMNNNNNVHSTIGTYFGINQSVSLIFSSVLNLEYDYFVLNKKENVCQNCHGLGYVRELDVNRIIDYDKTIADVPIKCWNRYRDFYSAMLIHFCLDSGINSLSKFRELDNEKKRLILYGISSNKYSVKYKTLNRLASRTTYYYGVMTGKPMLVNFEPSAQFYTQNICPTCHGEKYSNDHRNHQIHGYSIGQVMNLSFDKLLGWIDLVRQHERSNDLIFSINQIHSFAKKAVELNLGYLSLNRTIPSLSGGELQRLRLVQVFNTQLNDLLIVLDEPLASLSKSEKDIVYRNIKDLSKKHTLLVVDHHSAFFDDASKIIAIGEGSGKNGGSIIDAEKYISSQKSDFSFPSKCPGRQIKVSVDNVVYYYKGVRISIFQNGLNIVTGRSGLGKSTLLREYLPQFFEKYVYINQKSLCGNSRSYVATDLDVYNSIITLFGKKFGKDKKFFSNQLGSLGSCLQCNGTGRIVYGNDDFDRVVLSCKECMGTGFNKDLQKYKINNRTIFDIWKMSIDEACDYFEDLGDRKINEVLNNAKELLLGHLCIGQLTSTLSGGENLRVKILKALRSTAEYYGIDEPFKGLNNYEIYRVALFLSKLLEKGKTIIAVDHEETAFKYFVKTINLKLDGGYLVE